MGGRTVLSTKWQQPQYMCISFSGLLCILYIFLSPEKQNPPLHFHDHATEAGQTAAIHMGCISAAFYCTRLYFIL